MATAYQITGATCPVVMISTQGPFAYGGALYVIAISDPTPAAGKIGLFKSSDGQTWARVGSELNISGDVITNSEQLIIGCCPGINEQYAYVAYSGSGQRLTVSRANFAADDFDEDSSTGPAIAAGLGQGEVNRLTIAQLTDGDFGLTVTVGARSIDITWQVSTITLSEDLGSWGSLSDVSGQPTSGPGQLAIGTARGADGRAHGFAAELGLLGGQIAHVGSGGTYDLLSTFVSDGRPDIIGAAVAHGAGGTVAVLHKRNGAGVGGPFFDLVLSTAASSGSPSFGTDTVQAGGYTSDTFWAGLIDDSLTAIYRHSSSGNIVNGSTGATIVAAEATGICATGAGAVFVDLDGALWFVAFGATITGVSGIESGEIFGRTHGVSGGGEPPACGPGTPVLPAECGTSGPVSPTPPGEQNACGTSLGFAY